MPNPKTGHYECPRCNGRRTYESEETIGAFGMTLETENIVSPSIIRPTKGVVIRCKDCGERTKWFDSDETKAYKYNRETKQTSVILKLASVVSLLWGCYVVVTGSNESDYLAFYAWGASVVLYLWGALN